MLRFKPKIGVEIHAQLLTEFKLFSNSKVDWKAPINSQVALFDSASPGSMPVLNWDCVRLALRAAKATNCTIAQQLTFDRKHYDHWDLPCGYQITQKRHPIGINGKVSLSTDRIIRIKQIHLEQDSGKSFSTSTSTSDPDSSILVDLNRAGVGLIELVSEPEIDSPSEAALFVQTCHEMFQDLKICSGNLEQGAMRIDVNVNLIDRESGSPVSPRVELKNINGIKGIEAAINAELLRQLTLVNSSGGGDKLVEETRFFCPDRNETVLLRLKESFKAYRYLPEYDLPAYNLEKEDVKAENLVTRHDRIKKFQAEYTQLLGLDNLLLRLWTRPSILPNLFESSLKSCSDPRFLLNWYVGEFIAILNNHTERHVEISGEKMTELIEAVKFGKIDKEIAKNELFEALKESRDLRITALSKFDQNSIDEEINATIDELLLKHPDRVEYLKSPEGQKRGSVDFFIGPLLKRFRGKITAKDLSILLNQKIQNQ